MALAYAERLRQEKIQMYEDGLAKGGFLSYVAGWCGRPDLAKASTKRDFVGPRYRDRTNFLAIVPHRDRTGQGEDVSEEEMIRRAGRLDRCVSTTPQMLSISSLISPLRTGSRFFSIRRNCSMSVLTLT